VFDLRETMDELERNPKPSHQYPTFWEKGVPVFLVMLAIAVIILLIIIVVAATGLFGGM